MWRNKLIGLSLLLAAFLPAPANAVNCFWVGGTATWDGSNFTSWSTTTGGAGAGCPGATNVPTSSDVAIFDGNSGGGTVTVNATISISSLTTSAFTGTLDFSANNNNVNIGVVTAVATGWSDNGSGTHTVNMGSGTWTIDCTSTCLSLSGANMTLNANTSSMVIAARANSNRFFSGNGKTFNSVTFNGASASAIAPSGANTVFTALTFVAPLTVFMGANYTVTTLSVTSPSSSNPMTIRSSTVGTVRTITLTNSFTTSWAVLGDLTFSGGTNSATSSLDFGGNTGITITAPSTSSGGKIIGGWLMRCENYNDNTPCHLNKAA